MSTLAFGGKQPVRVLRQYPIPNAREVSPTTSIGLTAPIPYDRNSLSEAISVSVVGSKSGAHVVRLRLSDDAQTLILDPISPFENNEIVSVNAQARLKNGEELLDKFEFRTMVKSVSSSDLLKKMSEFDLLASAIDTATTPDTLPPLNVTVDKGATIGTFYFANFGLNKAPNHNFLFNVDQHGTIVQAQNRYHSNPLDFKVQPNGTRTFFDGDMWRFLAVDSAWHPIDTFNSANGYLLDEHELRLLPDGGYAVLAISITSLDSTQYEPGMVPGATIGGNVIQIFDAHRNLTFEWRGIDHYRIADAIHVKISDSSLDFQHANSLELDSDGNIIISNRHLSEISKISGQTGQFMWRMGGQHNEFALEGDSIWFSYQHCARLLPNGHMTLFDNADFDSVTGVPIDSVHPYYRQSRAVEYVIDTAARIARLVWQWHHTPETFSIAMGSVQRLRNGHTVIGWGLNFNVSVTEINRYGETLFEMDLGPKNVSYRAFLDPVDSLLDVHPRHALPNALAARFIFAPSANSLYFSMPKSEGITIAVYDVLGREVLPRTSSFAEEGPGAVPIGTDALTAGSYYCTLRTASGLCATAPFMITR